MHGEERNGRETDGEKEPPTERWFVLAFVSFISRTAADQLWALDEEIAAEVSAEEEDKDGCRCALQLYSWVGEEIAFPVLGLLSGLGLKFDFN